MHQHAHKYYNEGMEDAANAHGVLPGTRSDLQRYMDTRHLPCQPNVSPHTPPAASEKPEIVKAAETVSTVALILAKPAAVVVAVVAGAKFAIGAATVGVVAAGAGMEAWAMAHGGVLIAGACVAIAGLVAWGASLFGGGASKSEGSNAPPNDGGKYEWCQEQRQGWRKM